ncbi:MAG: DUF4214 domain-containing protein [Desulfobacterales bacterium]|nr:DUF4214 domain-containing protein [Desulfobacterales bacterium]
MQLVKRNIFCGILPVILIVLTQLCFAAEVPQTTAEHVALNFMRYLGENYSIHEIEPMAQSGKKVGYLVKLSPQGYILVAGDTIRVPIKAYSLTSNFDTLPPAYVDAILNELKLPLAHSLKSSGKKASRDEPEDTNRAYWKFLTKDTILSKKNVRTYTPDTYLLTTKWNQGYPYNKFNPKLGDELTITGCTQTALAQVMRYHAYPSSGSGVFNHTWNGQTLTAVMNRQLNWSAMPDDLNSTTEHYQQEEVAALMRDLGIMNEANLGIDGTYAYFHHDYFERAFGYAPVLEMDTDNSNFFSTIISEINNRRPILLAMPGHMTVADGYASDGSGKKIHVNLGWGGAYDDYYYLDQTNIIGDYTFSPNHIIYYNIQPCQDGECNPYIVSESGNAPVISSDLNEMIINTTKTLRIETYDPDGDNVTLSAASSCNSLQVTLNGNLLTLTPSAEDIFCEIAITANSNDGKTEKKFRVLVLENLIYMGTEYDISGKFANQTEIDEYSAYFEGLTTISGNRGYNNQAFFIWVKDKNGNVVIPASNAPISGTLTADFYTIGTSLKNPFTNYYYGYDANFSSYILNITSKYLNRTVSDIAETKGIMLTDDTEKLSTISTHQGFVEQQYRDFLGREGDSSGIGYWTSQLDSETLTRSELVNNFYNSAEFQHTIAPIARLYFAYFNRLPDYDGLKFWIGSYTSGVHINSISDAFSNSQEFTTTYGNLTNTEFATLVYKNVMGRDPDTEGLHFWVDQLVSGLTRGMLMVNFSESEEYKNIIKNKLQVVMIYIGMLYRVPDQPGFDYWVNYVNSGASILDLINGFLQSTEYNNRFLK